MKRLNYISWEEYFMGIAILASQRSKDPDVQVGACIVNPENKIVGIGYNGFPIGCDDDLLPWTKAENFLDCKLSYVCHAELNAILNSNNNLTNCTIYVTYFPCNECTKLIIQSGIKKVIYLNDKNIKKDYAKVAIRMMNLANIKYEKFNGKKMIINFEE